MPSVFAVFRNIPPYPKRLPAFQALHSHARQTRGFRENNDQIGNYDQRKQYLRHILNERDDLSLFERSPY